MPIENNDKGTEIAVNRILSIEADKINKTFLEEMFAAYHDKETNQFKDSNFKPTDKIELTNKQYKYVTGKIETTLGRLVFNRYVLERTGFIEHLGYWNKEMNAKGLSALNVAVNNLVINDKMTTKDLGNYIDSRDTLGFWCAAFLAVSVSAGLLRPMENVNKRKMELFKEHQEALHSSNSVEQVMTANKIEKELMSMVRENLKDDIGYDMYASGDGNLDNNYKTINVMRGAVFNNITKKYDVVESSLMDGVKKKDITAFANSVVAAAYPSAVGTAEAGYLSKIILSLLQSEHIDPNPDSDCGTKATIPFTVTEKNKQYILFRYLDIDGKKVLTNLENINSFVGKTVNMYSPQGCTHDAICGKCAGRVFHNLGVTQIGLLTTQITQKLLNLKLKAKHDLSQSAGIIPENGMFLHPNKYYHVENGMLVNNVSMKVFVPRILEDDGVRGFYREPTSISCMGILPVKFYDRNDNELLSTMMTVPAMISLNIYNDIQEDIDNYIISYDPESDICSMGIQKTFVNVETFINQIYIHGKTAQIPYNLLTNMMFKCLDINGTDLTGPSIIYELLARRVCRVGNDTFAKVYGKNPNVDQMSYVKKRYDTAVQEAGVLQAVLFERTSESINIGLSQTLDGLEPTPTPMEAIIKA